MTINGVNFFSVKPFKAVSMKGTQQQKLSALQADAFTASFKSKSSDAAALEDIQKYNEEIRKPRSIEELLLYRNPVFMCSIPYQKESFYRTLGESGWIDFLETGLIRPKQDTKQNYDVIYLNKGFVNNIYTRRGGGRYILETQSDKIEEGVASYPRTDKLEKGKDAFRIWHQTENGFEIVYDTMEDVISRNPDFRYAPQV